MSHTDPTSMPFDDAMLSAYLDDELTADQRARVEAHLADHSAARQLLDELGVLARAVNKLPQEALDPGFHAAVMAAIDRAAVAKPAPVEQSESRAEVAERSPGWFRGRARGWVWSAVAVAAALMVMFLSGEWPVPQRDVAKVGEPLAESAGDFLTDLDERTEDAPAGTGVDHAFVRSGGAEPRDPAAILGDTADRAPEAFVARPPEAPTAKEPLAPDGDVASSGFAFRETDAPDDRPSPAAGKAATRRPSTRYRGEATRADNSYLLRPDQYGYFAAKVRETLQRRVDRGAGEAETDELITELERYAPSNEPIVVVQVDLAPVAMKKQAFEAVLANNRIEIEPIGEGETEEVVRQLGVPAEEDPQDGAEVTDLDVAVKVIDAAAEKYDAVVVEATPEQIHAALNELNNDLQNCLALDIRSNEQAPELRQQWLDYGRGQTEAGKRAAVRKLRSDSDLKLFGRSDTTDENKEKGAVARAKPPALKSRTDQAGRAWTVQLEQRTALGRGTDRNRVDDHRRRGGGAENRGGLASGGLGGYGGRGGVPELAAAAAPQPTAERSEDDNEGLPIDESESRAVRGMLAHGVAPNQVRAVFLLRFVPEAAAAVADEAAPADANER